MLGGTAMLVAALAAPNSSNDPAKPAWVGIGFGMMLVGPATGHWYAGELGGMGLGVRSLAVVGTGAAFLLAFHEDGCGSSCRNDEALGAGLLVASAGAWLASSVYDIVSAPGAVRAWNREHGVVVAPTAIVSATGQHVPGVAVALRF